MEEFFELNQEESNPLDKYIGESARPKVGKNKFLDRIQEASTEEFELVEDFFENGGDIIDTNDENLCIEVGSGTFEIPAFCVKIGDV